MLSIQLSSKNAAPIWNDKVRPVLVNDSFLFLAFHGLAREENSDKGHGVRSAKLG